MIGKILKQLLSRVRVPGRRERLSATAPQVALPLRADLPLRERSQALVAVPAQISGAQMGSGKL